MSRSSLVAIGIVAAATLQAPQPGQIPVFRASVDLYTIHVAVTDASGAPIDDLGIEDFRLVEDGREQDVAFVLPVHEAPLDVAVVLDLSSSMSTVMPFVRQDIHGFLDALSTRDCVLLVTFRDTIAHAVWAPPHHFELRAVVDDGGLVGMTTLFDAAVAALEELAAERVGEIAQGVGISTIAQPREFGVERLGGCPSSESYADATIGSRRRAMVIVSDGGDTGSEHSLVDVQNAAKLAGVSILGVGPAKSTVVRAPLGRRPGSRRERPPRVPTDIETMINLASGTGGYLIRGRDMNLAKVLAWLRSTYLIAYRPKDGQNAPGAAVDFEMHEVEVQVLRDNSRVIVQPDHYRPTFDPDAGRPELEQAKELLKEGNAADALALLELAIPRDPQRSESHFQRAIALAELGRPEEALQSARRATRVDSGVGAAHYLVGRLSEQLGDLETAWQELANAHLAGYDVTPLRTRLEGISDVPESFETRLSAPRIFVQLMASAEDLAQIRAYRDVVRATRRALADEPGTGVVVRPELSDYFLSIVPMDFEPGEPATMRVRVELHDTQGDRRRNVDVAITNLHDAETLTAELRSGIKPIVDWLASNWARR